MDCGSFEFPFLCCQSSALRFWSCEVIDSVDRGSKRTIVALSHKKNKSTRTVLLHRRKRGKWDGSKFAKLLVKGSFHLLGNFSKRVAEMCVTNILFWQLGCIQMVGITGVKIMILLFSMIEQAASPLFTCCFFIARLVSILKRHNRQTLNL